MKIFHKNIEIEDFIKDMQTPFSIYRRDYKKHLITVVLEVDKSKEINKLKTPLTEGEYSLVKFFDLYLPIEWEIYLNGDRPDIVL